MKRLLFCIIALVFVLAACGNNDSSSDKDSKSSSKDDNTLRVGTEGTYAPFTFHNKQDKLTGYDIDVIKAVAKAENLKLKFNETSWDSMFAGLDAGALMSLQTKLVSIKIERRNINSLILTLIQAQY